MYSRFSRRALGVIALAGVVGLAPATARADQANHGTAGFGRGGHIEDDHGTDDHHGHDGGAARLSSPLA